MKAAGFGVLLSALVLSGCTGPLRMVGGECGAVPPLPPVCRQPIVQATELLANSLAHVRVDARCHWVHSGLLLQSGERYRFRFEVVEPWVDWHTAADPVVGWTGDRSWMERSARLLARVPSKPMYSLIGAEGEDPANFFAVDPMHPLTARTSQELLFFANDWPGRYHNNQGCIEVIVERIRP